MKKVAVIILNFNVKKELLKCIESVQASTYKGVDIIVVDNHSNVDISYSLEKFKDLRFIQNKENLGYTGGNNIGIKVALELGVDYCLILNPDTQIDRNCIKNLVKGAEKLNAGIAGPKIYFAGEKRIWHAGGLMDSSNVIGSHRGVDEEDHGQYDNVTEVDFVSGAAFFVKREVFEKIGYFDENFFLYYEDADFCLRAKKAGFTIYYIPSSLVYHENASSTGLGSPLQDYFITRNRMLYASKHLSLRTKFALLREGVRNLANPMRRLALFDFLIGNFGKGSLK